MSINPEARPEDPRVTPAAHAKGDTAPVADGATPVTRDGTPVAADTRTTGSTAPPAQAKKKIRPSRTGFTWVALVLGALIGIVLLIFILQNMEAADVDLLFWSFSLPIGVGALLAAISGALIMAVVGGIRMFQLRRVAKRNL